MPHRGAFDGLGTHRTALRFSTHHEVPAIVHTVLIDLRWLRIGGQSGFAIDSIAIYLDTIFS